LFCEIKELCEPIEVYVTDPHNTAKYFWAWLPEFLTLRDRRARAQVRLLGLAVLVGIVAGLGAILFYVATRAAEHYALGEVAGYRPAVRPAGEAEIPGLIGLNQPFRPWLLLVVPTIGGILSGWLVYTFAPEAEGHGTDAVIAAYHNRQGQIRPRVPLIKIVASALTIGSGGSGGREGPIAQIGAGFGSLLGNLLKLTAKDRRILVAAGMGAGIAAIFRAPLAGALFAAEVLYSSPEFEPEVIMPAAIASVVSYCTFGIMAGWKPLFDTPDLTFTNPWELGPYLLLVFVMILLASLYTRTFYGTTKLFRRLPLPRHLVPAIGALLTGLTGLLLYYSFGRNPSVLAVMSFGYGSIQQAMTDENAISGWVLLAIALGKILTTSLTIGSGGSGGVFGPSMVIGGCGGGALGVFLHHHWPGLVPHPATFVIVGMAGFFAAAAKTPISTLVIVSEMTGGYHLLLPALWVCVLAFLLSDERSIYSAQMKSRSRSPAHRGSFVRDLLGGIPVSRFFDPEQSLFSLHASDSLETVLERLDESAHSVLTVVDRQNRLLGVVDLEDVHVAAQASHVQALVVAEDLMRTDVVPLIPQDTLDRALELFIENDLPLLPVVNDLRQRKVLGVVRRQEIGSAYLRHLHGPRTPLEQETHVT
jgi:CIC family chloride channel protein